MASSSDAGTESRRFRTPALLRLYRYVRVTLHMLQGVGTTTLVFPWIDMGARRRLIGRWSRQLLRMMAIEVRVQGLPRDGLPGNVLLVANHVSWLDIFVLNALQPSRFIAKVELRRWPLVGQLIAGCGTLFIERARRRDTLRINQQASAVLAAGDTIAIFPEGTTTDGTVLLPFHGSLLQPIVDAKGHLQPVAIRYRRDDGSHSLAPAYVGELSFMASFWRVLGERNLVVDLILPAPIPAASRHRGELARAAEASIRAALALPARDSGPGRRGDLPA